EPRTARVPAHDRPGPVRHVRRGISPHSPPDDTAPPRFTPTGLFLALATRPSRPPTRCDGRCSQLPHFKLNHVPLIDRQGGARWTPTRSAPRRRRRDALRSTRPTRRSLATA